jgi:zinc finger BED domain-containing protein 5/7/8/9
LRYALVGKLTPSLCYVHASGVIARVKEIAPAVVWIHCSIHREALASKKMPPRLKNVLDTAVKVVNYIKARPLQSRLFNIICQEMGSTHLQLLFHTEVRWLSRGKVLTRLFELREEIRIFFTDHPFQHHASLDDPAWISLLAYLADIFSRLNDLNRGLQGNVTIFDVHDKIASMVKKLEWLQNSIQQGDFSAFPNLDSYLKDSTFALGDIAKADIEEHLAGLQQQFHTYFPTTVNNNNWARNPFAVDTGALPQSDSS